MRILITTALVAGLVTGCGPAPDTNKGDETDAAEQSKADALKAVPMGYFSDLEQFADVKEILAIGSAAGGPVEYLERLNGRYTLIIEPHQELLKGAKLLDFGSYDGRWSYAALDAGAAYVKGIEISQDYVDQANKNMAELGVDDDKYDFVVGDLLAELRKIEAGEYDGIINAGIFYHITYHVELMKEMKRLNVDFIILDSAVVLNERPVVRWSVSPYGLEGTPSVAAIQMLSEQMGFAYEQIPSEHFETRGMYDYSLGNRVTFTLRPGELPVHKPRIVGEEGDES